MKTLYMTVGLPGSGKSTWALQKLAEHPGAYKRINKDLLRELLDGSKWSPDNEKFVLITRDMLIAEALQAGKHVIIDDTGFAPKHRIQLAELAKQYGAGFEIVDFTNVPLETCIERDLKRPNSVGERVIRDMWRRYLAPAPAEPPPHDPALPGCVICDIDGTVAIRQDRSPFDWRRVGQDKLNDPVAYLLRQLECDIVFVSGRDEVCRAETVAWLQQYGFYPNCKSPTFQLQKLFMRQASDNRDDRIVKQEIYEREIKGHYNVRFVLDDRNKVVALWRDLGLPCFQVADGDF